MGEKMTRPTPEQLRRALAFYKNDKVVAPVLQDALWAAETPLSKVEIISDAGRVFVGRGDVSIEFHYDDDGRTLKIFVLSKSTSEPDTI